MRRVIFVVALLTSGCGTLANMSGWEQISIPGTREPSIYGGVGNDLRWAGEQIKWSVSPEGVGPLHLLAAGGFVVDLPFSFVGDTLTIPKIIERQPGAGEHNKTREKAVAGAALDGIE